MNKFYDRFARSLSLMYQTNKQKKGQVIKTRVPCGDDTSVESCVSHRELRTTGSREVATNSLTLKTVQFQSIYLPLCIQSTRDTCVISVALSHLSVPPRTKEVCIEETTATSIGMKLAEKQDYISTCPRRVCVPGYRGDLVV
uniref:Uncharacterized protein n=1 Tax=Timema poppense TaxID=170557 RepID=A0A7R9CTH9_TIMPO|nr:unnamed protein product [Timema poppensis]